MNVIFFGASVTQQGFNHKTNENVGYITWLKELIKEEGLEITINSIAAGGAHFDGAGYVLLSKVLKKKPDILFIDWHSTWLDKFSPLLWNSFLSNIVDQNIHLVIAILPIAEVYDSEKKRENHLQAEEVACESIHLLDGYKFKGFSPKIHLRDNYHTTKEGGKLYASNFLNYLKLFLEKKNIFNGGPKTYQYSFYVPLSKRPLVDLWEFNSGKYIKAKKMKIKYEIEATNPFLELIMELHIGPDSPVLDLKPACIMYGGEIKDKFSIWDPWCHFSRVSYKSFTLNKYEDILEIDISDQLPDYTKCLNTEFNFSEIIKQDKYIWIRNIYIIGGKFKEIEWS